MNSPKVLVGFAIILFGLIGIASWTKKDRPNSADIPTQTPIEVSLEEENNGNTPHHSLAEELPQANHIEMLFNTGEPKFPFVKTIRYTSRVDWLHGRPAWIIDYASHFNTSQHFIARSLHGGTNYENQNVRNGDYFNILDPDRDLRFHLVVDISRTLVWFYAYDATEDTRYLIKTYPVGLGRPDDNKASGYLTPVGRYELGSRVAIFTQKSKGNYQGEKTDMISVFGTRWIPFEKAITGCTEPAKGLGIHGVPWVQDPQTDQFCDENVGINQYESDGCIRFVTADIEEVFSIIITKPTTIDIVKNFQEAELPGKELSGQEAHF